MGYRRMNITLPAAVAKRLEKVPNKSAFIARAVVERFAALAKEQRRVRLLKAYRAASEDPAYMAEERRLVRELREADPDGLSRSDW
jgi:hypothetical protein